MNYLQFCNTFFIFAFACVFIVGLIGVVGNLHQENQKLKREIKRLKEAEEKLKSK